VAASLPGIGTFVLATDDRLCQHIPLIQAPLFMLDENGC
jgi:hypothetical protein